MPNEQIDNVLNTIKAIIEKEKHHRENYSQGQRATLFTSWITPVDNLPYNVVRVSNFNQAFADELIDEIFRFIDQEGDINEDRIVVGPGFCFGGSSAIQIATRKGERLAGIITAYGSLVGEYSDPSTDNWGSFDESSGPVLVIGGELDTNPAPEELRAFGEALSQRNIDNQVLIYEGVSHAFINPEDIESDPTSAAAQAWQEILSFTHRV